MHNGYINQVKVNEVITDRNKMSDKISGNDFSKGNLKNNVRFSELRYITK